MTNIRIFFFWMCQSIFYLAAALSALNRFWAGVGVSDYFVAVWLGGFIAVIFMLLHLLQADAALSGFAERNWLSAFIIGTLLGLKVFLVFILIIIVTEIIWWFLLQKIVVREFLSATNELPVEFAADKTNEININNDVDTNESSELIWNNGKTQQIIRSRTELGGEKIEGYFLVEFVGDQLTASVHVSFYPMFDELPLIDAHLIDAEAAKDAKLTVAKIQRFGARIDIKRTNKNIDKLRLVVVVNSPQ
ncbi:MAG: hypothetical protein LBC74_01175 [Planctomycetaceae bacterium]|nr:hypothetical protein [Planctomycetaceae bacterium]